jgi:hypothetical protein
MAPIQQELPRHPAPDASPPPEDLDDLYEDEPRRRSWAAVASVVLSLAVIFVGYQWHQAAGREHVLATQLQALRADAETVRLRADEAEREVEALQKRLAAAGAEKAALSERVVGLERAAQERASVTSRVPDRARERAAGVRAKPRATPVVVKKRL